MPIRPGRWPHIDRERLPLDERVGQYVLNQPVVRSVRESPEGAGPWIVLGLAVALAGLIAGMPAAVLVLFVGILILYGVHLHARGRRQVRPSNPGGGLRLALVLIWFAAMVGVMGIIVSLEVSTGGTGIVLVVASLVVFPIAIKLLQLMLRGA